MNLGGRFHIHVCPEHGCQVGRGDDYEWLCREGHRVPLPKAVDVVRAATYQGAVSRIAELEAENARQAEALKVANEALEVASAEMYESLRRQGGQ